jgi:serine/threonine-protein kinase RsbT
VNQAASVAICREGDLAILVSRLRAVLRGLGLADEESGRLLTTALELGRNIVKYAGHGTVTLDVDPLPRGLLLRVTAVDHGPGIPDVDAALRDHFSTGGTLGLGLPGVRRLMDRLDIVTAPGRGCRITAERLVPR